MPITETVIKAVKLLIIVAVFVLAGFAWHLVRPGPGTIDYPAPVLTNR